MLRGKPVLVTGANGFLGRVLVRKLAEEGAHVKTLVLPGERVPTTWDAEIVVHRGDVTCEADVARAMRNVQVVFHLAAVVGDAGDDALHQRITVGGTRLVAERAAAQRARLVLASSIVTYGDRIGREVCDESTPHGRANGPYSRAKQGQERVVNELVRTRGLDAVVVRPGNVYGPGSGPWLLDLLDVLRRGLPSLIGGGDFDAGLAYVDNVVDVLVRASTLPEVRGLSLLAVDGLHVTWREYFTDVAAIVGAPKPRVLPLAVARALAPPLEHAWRRLGLRSRPPITREAIGLVGRANRFDDTRTRSLLSYEPAVGYEAGMRATAAYMRARGAR